MDTVSREFLSQGSIRKNALLEDSHQSFSIGNYHTTNQEFCCYRSHQFLKVLLTTLFTRPNCPSKSCTFRYHSYTYNNSTTFPFQNNAVDIVSRVSLSFFPAFRNMVLYSQLYISITSICGCFCFCFCVLFATLPSAGRTAE